MTTTIPEPRWIRRFAQVFLALPLITMAGVILSCEQLFSCSISWIFCAAWIVASLGLSIPFWFRFRSKLSLILGGGFIAFVLTLHFRDTFPDKPYLRFYDAIEVGMDEDRMMAELGRQFPAGGRFPTPVMTRREPEILVFVLDPQNAYYDSWAIYLYMNGGRLVGKEYSPF
jgi:hypothetical protein